jgi:hypothetical protein
MRDERALSRLPGTLEEYDGRVGQRRADGINEVSRKHGSMFAARWLKINH